jgi:hypothetical protein
LKKAVTMLLAMLILPFVTGLQTVYLAKANPGPATSVPPVVSLSEAQVHATISNVNGELWAKVDASYQMNTVHALGDKFQTENYKMGLLVDPSPYVTVTVAYDKLEAYYPFPADAINISVKMNHEEKELISRNRSFHLFGEGNLPELTWTIAPVPRNFTLEVHYEHPIDTVNDATFRKYAFLFSLGARFGLDDLIYGYYGYYWFDNSTAHFEILIEPAFNEISAYSIEQLNPLDSTLSSDPLNCTVSKENEMKRVEFNLPPPASTLYESLTTSGAAVFLKENQDVSETSPVSTALIAAASIVGVAAVVAMAILVYWKKRKREAEPT